MVATINTDNQSIIDVLHENYTFAVPGFQYTPLYRNTGKILKKSFISKVGVFPTGLLNEIVSSLKSIGCTPDIEYSTPHTKVMKETLLNVGKLKYYDFQDTIIKQAIYDEKCIIKAPTGSGKTLIMAGIIANIPYKRGVMLFTSKQLLGQTYKFLTDTCKLPNIGMCYSEGTIYGNLILATVQSIHNLPEEHINDSDLVMVDECHEFSGGGVYAKVVEGFHTAIWRLGFTATVPKDNVPKYNLISTFGHIVEVTSASDLVEEGYLTKPIIQIITRENTQKCGDDYIQYLDAYKKYIVNNKERNTLIKTLTEKICKSNSKAKILIIINSLDHGDNLKKLIPGSEFIEGSTDVSDRYATINKFRRGDECKVLIGSKIMQTGISVDEITHFINARGMKSEIATVQALGRSLRKHKSKTIVYVYDFIDPEKYLNKHSKERINSYKREGHEVIMI